MSGKLSDKFEDFFKRLDELTESKSVAHMDTFVHEALKLFETIRLRLISENEEERQEAMQMAQKLQEKLMEHSQKAFQATGMNEEHLKNFLNQPENFNQNEWKVLEKAQKEISDYQMGLLKSPSFDPGKGTPKKGPSDNKSHWIPG